MKLSGLTLETVYFEDYLAFLTEVLELELFELTDISMRLDLQGTWLEIKKVPKAPFLIASNLEFLLSSEEFIALTQKIRFFYYRKTDSRFLLLNSSDRFQEVLDPDGRIWRFMPSQFLEIVKFNQAVL